MSAFKLDLSSSALTLFKIVSGFLFQWQFSILTKAFSSKWADCSLVFFFHSPPVGFQHDRWVLLYVKPNCVSCLKMPKHNLALVC